MLTPFFQLSQDGDRLFITVHAPYSNIADSEIYVDKDDFRFYSSPYYLRLHLPGHVVDCDEPVVRYNADNGQFNIELIKSNPGEHFQDLDLIAKFLSPSKNRRLNVKPKIEILSTSTNIDAEDDGDDDNDSDCSDEWLINQEEPVPFSETTKDSLNKTKYGFGNQSQDVFRIIKDEFRDIFDIINVEETSNWDRKKLREDCEDNEFNDDHYLFDLMEPSSELQEVLQYNVDYCADVKLTDDELNRLKNFGIKEYLLSKEDRRTAYLSLIDILYCYAYDHRTTLGETTVESAWTINKLCATFSWLQSYSSVKEVIISCVRRSLCYPLFRNWKLSLKVIDDTINILKSGNRQILRCLLKIHELFNGSEQRYVLNQLYITDYCIWSQAYNINSKLAKLSDLVLEVKESLTKSDVGFDIEILEVAAFSTVEDDLIENLDDVRINNSDSDDSEDSDDDKS